MSRELPAFVNPVRTELRKAVWRDGYDGSRRFAERAADALRRDEETASYGDGVQQQIAILQDRLFAIAKGATAGLELSFPSDVPIAADSLGNVLAGELPTDVEYSIDLFGLDVRADPRTEIVIEYEELAALESSPGTISVLDLLAPEGYITYTLTFAGVPQGSWRTRVYLAKESFAGAVNPTGVQTQTHSVTLGSISSFFGSADNFQVIGSTKINGAANFNISLNTAVILNARREGYYTFEFFARYKIAGTASYTNISPSVNVAIPGRVTMPNTYNRILYTQNGSLRYEAALSPLHNGPVVVEFLAGLKQSNASIGFESPVGIIPQ